MSDLYQPVIQSLLDTDLYKYTMQQAMVSRYGNVHGRMAFRCRSGGLNLDYQALREQIDALAELRLTDDELIWLGQLPYITPEFISWLRGFRLDPSCVEIQKDDQGWQIDVSGNWAEITHFEIFILAIVSELHCRNSFPANAVFKGHTRLEDKIQYLERALNGDESGFQLVDFGTRRRFSRQWQSKVVARLQEAVPSVFNGTSNLHLARTLGMKPVGTMAHEWLQAHQVLGDSLISSQRDALNIWLNEYDGQLGIALTDTISMRAFLNDFDSDLATAYSGIRHDSGDPVGWGEQALAHYKSLGIDPSDKTFVFSDKLDFSKAVDIYRHFAGRVNVSFGIGTYLTNDMGHEAPNIVLKLVEVDGRPVAKLSDSPGKVMCRDEQFVERLRRAFA
ncbi:MAG: nicotinate phosphoribosyltransferase [Endozoicomonas sp.]